MASLEHKYGFKLSRPRFESYREKEETAVIAKLEAKAQPCIGATQVLEELQRVQKYGLAVVSSSALLGYARPSKKLARIATSVRTISLALLLA